MAKFFSFHFLFIVCLLGSDNLIFAKKNKEKTPKIQGNFSIKIGNFTFSRDFLEQFLTNHPFLSIGSAAAGLGYCFYSSEIAAEIKKWEDYKQYVVGGGIAALILMYANRKKILDCVIGEQHDELEEDSSDNYSKLSTSGVKIYGPGEIKTKFKDVAGLQTAKEDLSDILLFLKHPKRFKEIGAHVPKGVLLSGAPGNGKTLLARALAGEASCPFLYISASQFIEAFVGMGAARVRHLFAIAKDLAPCIIFIDEIDAIGRKRCASGSSGDTELTQALNQLLGEMDGFVQQENPIVIIGATNRADILDEALVRPGRFDRKVEIHAPYIKDRYDILKIYFSKIKAADDIDIEKIASGTAGFSAADLANLVNEAAILCLREGKKLVQMDHVDQARDFMLLGRETKGMQPSQADLFKTAVHESGHALAYVYQQDAKALYKVTITPRGGALGLTYGMDINEQYSQNEQELRASIVVALGGSVAEEIILGRRGVGACSDLQHARDLATAMVMRFGMTDEFKDVTFAEFVHNQVHLPDEIATKLHLQVAHIISQCRAIATQIIIEYKVELLQLAEMLLDQGTVSGEDVYRLCGIQVPELEFSLTA